MDHDHPWWLGGLKLFSFSGEEGKKTKITKTTNKGDASCPASNLCTPHANSAGNQPRSTKPPYHKNRDLRRLSLLKLLTAPFRSETREDESGCRVVAEVAPALDSLVLFWSAQVPHEVLPTDSAARRAVSVWYLCPQAGGLKKSGKEAEGNK